MTGESTPGRTRRAVGDRRLVALAKEMGVLAAKVIDPAPADEVLNERRTLRGARCVVRAMSDQFVAS